MHATTWRAATILFIAPLGLTACEYPDHGGGTSATYNELLYPPSCTPSCVAGCGSSDGCGGICGCTAPGEECSATGECVLASNCAETCASTGYSCGEVCGVSCGSCTSEQVCVSGACLLPTDLSCASCPLQLAVISKTRGSDNSLTGATLALSYAPAVTGSGPRVADIRIVADRSVTLSSVQVGDALASAGKELYVDPNSQDPWQELSEGTHQLLMLSRTNSSRIEAGELARLSYTIDALVGVASFRIARRQEVVAPAEANTPLQASTYDDPVVLH